MYAIVDRIERDPDRGFRAMRFVLAMGLQECEGQISYSDFIHCTACYSAEF